MALPEYIAGDTFKHPGGAPRKISNCLDLEFFAALYFESCWTEGTKTKTDKDTGESVTIPVMVRHRPYTIGGLANAIGITPKTLRNYGKDEELFPTVKRLRAIIEQFNEEQLYEGRNVAGAIFAGKINHGWREESTVKHEHTLTIEGPMDTSRLKALIEHDDTMDAEIVE